MDGLIKHTPHNMGVGKKFKKNEKPLYWSGITVLYLIDFFQTSFKIKKMSSDYQTHSN